MIIDCRKCRTAGHGRCQCPDDGVLKDGQTLRVSMYMADAARADAASDASSMADAAYRRGVTDLNAWRGGEPATPAPSPYPTMRDSQRTSVADLARLKDASEDAWAKGVEDLNAWRAA